MGSHRKPRPPLPLLGLRARRAARTAANLAALAIAGALSLAALTPADHTAPAADQGRGPAPATSRPDGLEAAEP